MFLLCLFRRFSGVYRGYCTGLQWLNAHVLIALRVCSYGMGSDDGMRSDDGRSYIVRVKGQGGGCFIFVCQFVSLSVRQFVSFVFVRQSVGSSVSFFVRQFISDVFVRRFISFIFVCQFVSSSVTFCLSVHQLHIRLSVRQFVSSSVRQVDLLSACRLVGSCCLPLAGLCFLLCKICFSWRQSYAFFLSYQRMRKKCAGLFFIVWIIYL